MKKKYMKYQLIICVCIVICAYSAKASNFNFLNNIYQIGQEEVTRCITISQVEDWTKNVVSTLKTTPAHLVSVMVNMSEDSTYGEPIDEIAEGNIKTVHAVAGGVVIASGFSENMGLYVKIKHEEKISTYGNLENISVVIDERVKRGEYIGYYDVNNKEEFYFELEDLSN